MVPSNPTAAAVNSQVENVPWHVTAVSSLLAKCFKGDGLKCWPGLRPGYVGFRVQDAPGKGVSMKAE